MSSEPQGAARPRPPVIRVAPGQANFSASRRRVLPAWIISVLVNAVVFGLFTLAIFLGSSQASDLAFEASVDNQVVVDDGKEQDLTFQDLGFSMLVPPSAGSERLEAVDVFGETRPDQPLGVPGASDLPRPPGFGGPGAALPGNGGPSGLPGGIVMATGFPGRSAGTREKLALTTGGNAASEAAVAEGLLWLARHQAPDGHWSLDHFNRNVNVKFPAEGARLDDDGSTGPGVSNDVAGTAFGLLPFLGAGETHKPPPPDVKRSVNYQKVVAGGLRYLISKQTREGEFPGGMYAHGLATITLCEAYGLTADPLLKGPAQKAINFLVYAQNPTTGGWRYAPRTDGDTSVLGWQVMALKSGQLAGLSVPKTTLDLASKWLDSCMTSDKGGYGYTGAQETPTMTAVGVLCRMYLGWSPKNPGVQAGINRLVPKQGDKFAPRVAGNNMYYDYYATQVMHHFGGDRWENAWNPAMRDHLIKTQDRSNPPNHRGSWDPKTDVHGKVGGRVMITSLSLLTLEVYYRHLPLYRREAGVTK